MYHNNEKLLRVMLLTKLFKDDNLHSFIDDFFKEKNCHFALSLPD